MLKQLIEAINFWENESSSFSCCHFTLFASQVESSSFIFYPQMYSSLHHLILKLASWKKNSWECYLLQRAKLAVTRWCLWFDERLDIQGDFARNGNAMFSIFQALEIQLQNPCSKKQHCHLHCTDVFKGDFKESRASFFIRKKWNYFYKWISSSDVFLAMLHFCCRNWSCKNN